MIGIRHKETIELPGIIMPQSILMAYGDIFVFDKINMDEGRLYRFTGYDWKRQLVMEVDDGECCFGKDGFIYILNVDVDSVIEVYDYDGNIIKEITLKGAAYTIDIDENGYIYALFYREGRMSAEVYDNDGRFIRTIRSRNMKFLSALYSSSEYVYAGGFSEDTPIRIEMLNCMSYIKYIYNLKPKDPRLTVSRILKHDERLFALLSGADTEQVVAIDENNGDNVDIFLSNVDTGHIYDISISGNELLLLCSSKKVIVCEMTGENLASPQNMDANAKLRSKGKGGYGYLIYLTYISNFCRDFWKLLFIAAMPLTMISMLYCKYFFPAGSKPMIEYICTFIVMSNLAAVVGTAVWSMVVIRKKDLRLDRLLYMYNEIDNMGKRSTKDSLALGIVFSITAYALLYKIHVLGTASYIITPLPGVVAAIILYMSCKLCINRFKNDIDDIVFELLSFSAMEYELFKKISYQVKKIKNTGIEEYRIRVNTMTSIDRSMVKLINRWSNLRRSITGDKGKLGFTGGCMVFYLSLKNRDIKYSRISIIEDFICYIKRVVNISSVIIEAGDGPQNR